MYTDKRNLEVTILVPHLQISVASEGIPDTSFLLAKNITKVAPNFTIFTLTQHPIHSDNSTQRSSSVPSSPNHFLTEPLANTT